MHCRDPGSRIEILVHRKEHDTERSAIAINSKRIIERRRGGYHSRMCIELFPSESRKNAN